MDDKINIQQLVKEQYSKLPQQLKDAVTASDLPIKMKAIAEKHGLMLDKMNVLQNEILLVLLGLEPSSEFVNNVNRGLEMSSDKTSAIINDVSEQIFAPIKTHLREWEEQTAQEDKDDFSMKQESDQEGISAVENAGNFTINQDESAKAEDPATNKVGPGDRDKIIADIENPTPSREVIIKNTPETFTEPLADHLLNNATARPEQKIEQVAEKPSAPLEPPVAPPKPKGPDPYREPVK